MSQPFADTSSTPGIRPTTAVIGPFQRFFNKIVTGSYPLFIAALLGGVGFTMSLFISGLSFASAQFMDFSKLGIILASVISGILGLAILGLSGVREE